ncbi:MAG: hypothetical protein ACRDN8_18065 [Thermoleophilaceae bacterium]
MTRMLAALAVLAALLPAAAARGATYEVGPGKPYATLEDVDDLLGPGDLVLVSGGATYPGGVRLERDGSPHAPITIRGVGSPRPVIAGATNTIELAGDHTVLERLDLTGGSFRCLYLHADGLVVRDTVVHDCPAHGILGADTDSGDATLERVEVHHAGGGDRHHSIYMATDELAHPGSVFRMRHSWVHDATGGNLVKSRAERNEIAYNRLDGNGLSFHELELIGPDPAGGAVAPGVREDSDVVGNVLVHRRADFRYAARVGGDATGESEGRYRFVSNTFVGTAATGYTVFRAFDRLESIEAVGNVMHRAGGLQVLREAEAEWVGGTRSLSGAANWVTAGSDVPAELAGGLGGADPGLDASFRPLASSPLVDVGYTPPLSAAFEPPLAGLPGAGAARPADEALDIGAYELPDPRFLQPPTGNDGNEGGRRRLRLRLVRVRGAGLSFVAIVRVSRRARVGGVLLQRRLRVGAAARPWKRVRRLRPRTLSSGRRSLRIGRLRPGRYRLRLTARAGSARARASLRFRVDRPG